MNKSFTSILAGMILAGTQLLQAGTHVWSGAQNGYWSNPANWSSGGPPYAFEAAPVVIQLPSSASARRKMTNDVTHLSVDVLAFYGGNYTLHGDGSTLTLTGSQPPFPYAANLVSGASTNNYVDSSVILTFAGDISILVGTGARLSLDAMISGPGGFTKTGAGALSFSGLANNTYTGPAKVLDGTLFSDARVYGWLDWIGTPLVTIPGHLTIGDTNMARTPKVRLDDHGQLGNSALTINPNGVLELVGGASVASLTMTGGMLKFMPDVRCDPAWPVCVTNFPSLYCGSNFVSHPTPLSTATVAGQGDFHFVTASNGLPSFINVTGGKLIMDANISGNTTLHKLGDGELIWNGNDEFKGEFLIHRGILAVSGARPLHDNSFADSMTVSDGAQLSVRGPCAAFAPLHLNGFGPHGAAALVVEQDGATFHDAIHLDTDTAVLVSHAANIVSANLLQGPGDLHKRGPGILQLIGDSPNQQTGVAFAEAGALQLKKLFGMAAINGPLVIGQNGGGAVAEVRTLNANQLPASVPITIHEAGTLNLYGFNQTVGPITLQGGDIKTLGGTLTLSADLLATNGVGSIVSGAVYLGEVKRTFHLAPGYSINVQAEISDSPFAGGFDVDGGGTLTLSGASPLLSGPINAKAGVLYARNDLALGNDSGGTMVWPGARLAVDGRNLGAERLHLNGDGGGYGALSCSRTNMLTGPIALGSDTTINVASTTDRLILSGVVSGPGGITKIGAGTLAFTGNQANTYAGATSLSDGAMELNKSSHIAVPGALLIGDNVSPWASHVVRVLGAGQFEGHASLMIHSSGVLDLSSAFFAPQSVGSLSGSGPVKLGVSPLSVGGNDTDTQYNGKFTGTGDLIKHGAGKLTLGGTSDQFLGRTIVNSGTLNVQSWIPSSPVTVNAGGKLMGSGLVASVSSAGGMVSPGCCPTALKLTSKNLSLDSASKFPVELNGITPGIHHSQLAVTGAVDLGGATLMAMLGFNSAVSNRFTILDNDGNDPVNQKFKGLDEGATTVIGGAQFQITYHGGDGNDVVLTQISSVGGAQMSSLKKLANGGIQIDGTGFPNTDYTVQATANLTPPAQWIDIGTATANLQGQFQFTDAGAPNFPIRFYRFVLP